MDSKDLRTGRGFGLRRFRAGGKREVRVESTIAASPEAVWALVSDVERIQLWWPRAISGVVTGGEEIGREQVVVYDWGRRKGTVQQRVTAWEPPHRYGWRVTREQHGETVLPPVVDAQITIDVARAGALARVSIFASYEPVTPRGALALRQISRLARRTFRSALKQAQKVLLPGS